VIFCLTVRFFGVSFELEQFFEFSTTYPLGGNMTEHSLAINYTPEMHLVFSALDELEIKELSQYDLDILTNSHNTVTNEGE